ncbi:hypothetical protein [Obesumbacterium proteus]|uniref:hypothetical protein n=1 Tax=Obesumbacterium proteus TaxID=82983 RepID=UPI000699C30E|nr:hypothetical protein [Obesumbacterium proteus]
MIPKNVSSRVVSAGIAQALTGLSRNIIRLQMSQTERSPETGNYVSRAILGTSLIKIYRGEKFPIFNTNMIEIAMPATSLLKNASSISNEGQRLLLDSSIKDNDASAPRKLEFTLELNKSLLRLRSLVAQMHFQLPNLSWTPLHTKKITLPSKRQTASALQKRSLVKPTWLSGLSEKIEHIATLLGKSTVPYLSSVANGITLVNDRVNTWARTNTTIVQSVSTFIAGLATLTKMIIQVKTFVEKLTAPFVALMDLIDTVRKRWMLLKAAFSAGGNLHLITRGFSQLGKGLKATTLGLGAVGRFAGKLGLVLGGNLLRGVMLVGRAVVFLGRALIMNPIGLIITAIATAAYLIYRYWTPISAFFKRLWNHVTQIFSTAWMGIKNIWSGVSRWFGKIWVQIKSAFSGGVQGIAQLILRWSPLGLFIKAFSSVMSWFGVDIPKKFSDFGSQMITGLVKGVTQKLAAAKESIVSFSNSVSGWFKSALGINSPSRIFIGFGDNIVQGVAVGIVRTAPQAAKASLKMAKTLLPDIPAGQSVASASASHAVSSRVNPIKPNGQDSVPAIPTFPAAPSHKVDRSEAAATGGIHVNFSPNITMNSKSPTAADDLSGALKLSVRELEKMLEKIANQQNRRGYA